MDDEQLLDYEEEQEETHEPKAAENGSGDAKKIKVFYFLNPKFRECIGIPINRSFVRWNIMKFQVAKNFKRRILRWEPLWIEMT